MRRAMLNLSDVLARMDPVAAADAARTAAPHLRRAGSRVHLAVAITNLAEALLHLGDWDAAEARDIAGRLRCQPVLDRADALTPQHSATAVPQDSPRIAR